MRWEDISIDGTWTIPTEDREKGNAGSLLLPSLALDIINAQPRLSRTHTSLLVAVVISMLGLNQSVNSMRSLKV